MGIATAATKVEDWFKTLDVKAALKKTVTVPLKVLLVGGIVIFVLAMALSLAHKAQPRVERLLGVADAVPSDIEVLASIDDLKKQLAAVSVCKKAGK